MERLEKIAANIAAWKSRIAIIVMGQAFNATVDWIFNNPIYGYVINGWGLYQGFAIMALLSFLTCLAFIKIYDWLKVDWLGVEVAKEVNSLGPIWIKNLNIGSKFVRVIWWPFSKLILFVLWAVNKGGLVAFLVLSMFTDPFVTTVCMRRGWGMYDGLNKRSWLIFLASTVVGNIYWSIRTFALLTILGVNGYVIFLFVFLLAILISIAIKKWGNQKE